VGSSMVTFQVDVEDNGEPGIGNDKFRIVIMGSITSTRDGTLTQGNIQFHY
jgi:hypothetical protein